MSTANRAHVCWLVVGIVIVVATTVGPVAAYASVLFWVKALQVLLLLYVAPFFLAMGRPVTLLGCQRSASPFARVLAHPATTSIAMLATPWLLYMTGWYEASLRHVPVAVLTHVVLLTVGFFYYYARLQVDPVPRRYSQLLSVVISIGESLGDGLLGLVLWLGPLIAVDYYRALDRQWGPSQRVDQSIGAGVLWLVGDAFGLVFVVVLMRLFASDDKASAQVLDAELDRATAASSSPSDVPAQPGLWWESDPQLRDRMRRR